MYKAKCLPDDYKYETEKITIEIPKNLVFMTITGIYEPYNRARNKLCNYNVCN